MTLPSQLQAQKTTKHDNETVALGPFVLLRRQLPVGWQVSACVYLEEAAFGRQPIRHMKRLERCILIYILLSLAVMLIGASIRRWLQTDARETNPNTQEKRK